jgi:hypothetical protein
MFVLIGLIDKIDVNKIDNDEIVAEIVLVFL